MTEETKTQPEKVPDGQEQKPETEQKSAEEQLADVKAENERLEKQVKDKETFIGKQSSEIGELRKFKNDNQSLIEDAQTSKGEVQDKLVAKIADKLKAKGYTGEEAQANAETLADVTRTIMDADRKKLVMSETIDLVEEAMEDGKIDKALFSENENEVMAEFNNRKLAPTARGNFRLMKQCYDDVIRRKADKVREERKGKDEANRDAQIAGQELPAGGKKEQASADEDQKARDAIKGAGSNRSNAFF